MEVCEDKAFLKVVYTHLCTAHHRKHVIPIFCIGGHFRKLLHALLLLSEEDLEKLLCDQYLAGSAGSYF